MPHCIIDFSANVPGYDVAEGLTRACHSAMVASGLFEPASIKTRAHQAEAAKTGEGDDSFIHVNISIMPGRSSEQKRALMDAIAVAIDGVEIQASSLTMEVRELEKAHYFKKLT
ncbi:5-carboxymethyl-2-hydroxymuconate Delta-isomerase [Shewanella litorisediminis]|uniref:5-carboxymethyl-2-hydroxymuconate Delta-isomerase n=1 Tax=Shewanella litorisediminis TaxID=1173586 RepID=A0ABX7FZC6_9GAMM|nr:5-carboxymethyl-2-hydroxymuconate Delta-isomerase [Shewanella litorisediminis]MCL2919581.1 5-carboxymethyl-2-hydroxymuconate Delta-isomerase [Shewanella litorisediminis]QRH00383.1 5-carboxymethyl-2-hydroxymuconate Delta-isomerase [Shewanella litorisediminis]